MSFLLIWYSAHSTISRLYLNGFILWSVMVQISLMWEPSSHPAQGGPRSAASRGMDHSSYPHAHSGLWLHVCAWGEDSQRAASLSSTPQPVCALLSSCSGCCWDVFWRKGCRAAGTHQYHRHWAWHEWQVKEAFEGGLGTGMCSSPLRCAQAPYSDVPAPFWTYSFNLWHKQTENWQGELDLHVFLFPPPFFNFFEGLWVEFLLSSLKETNFLSWHWLWSLWASGAPVKWLTGWKVGLNP